MFSPDLLSAADRLLSEIAAVGGSVVPYRYILRVFPPPGGLSPDILSRLGQHRPAMACLLGYAPESAGTIPLEVVGLRPRTAYQVTVQEHRRILTPTEPATASEPMLFSVPALPPEPMPVREAAPEPDPPPPPRDLKKLQGGWVRVGGGGWRYRLPRLSEPCFALLCRVGARWTEITGSLPDPRTMRALEGRELAEFGGPLGGELVGRLTRAGVEVRDAYRRKVAARLRQQRRAGRVKSEGGSGATVP